MADNTVLNAGTGGDTIAADDIGGVKYQRVKNCWGPDGAATDADTTTPLPAIIPDVTASGNITTQNLVPAGAATANSAVEITMAGRAALTIQVTGTYTGALTVQGTVDGSTWVSFTDAILRIATTGAMSAQIASATQSIFTVHAPGFNKLRVTALAAVTGTAAVTLRGTANPAICPVPTGANTIGAVTLAALPTGSNQIGMVVQQTHATIGGAATFHHAISAGSTNATNVKAGVGAVYSIVVSNTNAAVRFFKLYNKATAPTVGTDTPLMTVAIPPGGTIVMVFPMGLRTSIGIAYALTTGIAVADTGAVGTDMSVAIAYT